MTSSTYPKCECDLMRQATPKDFKKCIFALKVHSLNQSVNNMSKNEYTTNAIKPYKRLTRGFQNA